MAQTGIRCWQGDCFILNYKLFKNENYFQKDSVGNQLPYLEAVSITFLPEKQSEFLQLVKGKIDYVSGIDNSYKDEIITNDGKLRELYKDKIEMLKKVNILKSYIEEKQNSIVNTESDCPSRFMNERHLTNIGTFRRYIIEYLNNHPEISKECTILVRQLENKGEGIPIELYCFTYNTGWIQNESIMADIFDHLYTVAKHFDLTIYQSPTGKDFQRL